MKKTISLAIIFIIILGSIFFTLNIIDGIYSKKINTYYNNSIGIDHGNEVKIKGIALQKKSIENKDILIFGSSELGSRVDKFYPPYFFNGKNGFQLNLIGRGFSQSLIHSVNIASLGKELSGKKVVVIISPQWFTKNGLNVTNFNMNFSSLQFYKIMNSDLDKNIKGQMCDRIYGLNNQDKTIKLYTKLWSKNNIISKAELLALKPYFNIKYKILDIKDKIKSYKLLKNYKQDSMTLTDGSFNWEGNLQEAEKLGKSQTDNNQFQIENTYYDKYIRNNLSKLKNNMKDVSYTVSPEYEDLELLISICKYYNIKPLFISVPVNGKWYDYSGFSRENRQEYYNKVNSIITSNGFRIADLSSHEYEEYFLKDIMHLGWKGWVYVDKEIYEYFSNDR